MSHAGEDPLAGNAPLAAVILPPREGFGAGRAGALGLLARRYATTPGFRTLVIGGEQSGPPFPEVPFQSIKPASWCPGNINLRFVAAMIGTLRRLHPALIEVHNRPEIALALALLFPRIPVGLLLNNDPMAMRAARSPAARRRLLRRLRPVMAASDYVRRRFMEGIDPAAGRVEVLHNCIDLVAVPPPAEREKLILFAGRVVADKAPDSFIRACALALPSLPGWRAEIIGADGMSATSRETDYVRHIKAQAMEAGVGMTGYRDHPLVLEAMTRAAIVIVPSRWNEPFGLTALEALACGAPLIVSPRGGLPEVAGDAAVYANPDAPAEIAAAIIALAADQARREALSAAGQERARRFDTPVAAARLAALRHAALNDR
ncbi:MAG: glycosyltransferase family 4 protein [Acetobacteraceae bacterium]|jgi:glycosyltransferase involved in cell wall biosynthesis